MSMQPGPRETSTSQEDNIIPLELVDGSKMTIPRRVALKSNLISNMIEYRHDFEENVPLTDVSCDSETVKHLFQHLEAVERGSEALETLEREFLNVSPPMLIKIILLTNYLDVPDVCHSAMKKVAEIININQNSPEKVRKIFNITKKFTDAEKKSARE